MLTYDESVLADRIGRLHPRARAEFALRCAERLVPLYEQYARVATMPTVGLREMLLEARRAFSREDDEARAVLIELLQRLESMVPEDDPAVPRLVPDAQSAAIAACYAVSCCLSGETQHAVFAASQAYEVADDAASQTMGIDVDRRAVDEAVRAHPLVQAELATQAALLTDLEREGA